MPAHRAILVTGLTAGAVLAVAMAVAAPVSAEVRVVESRGDAVVIEAHDATVRDVLNELVKSQKLQIDTTAPLAENVTGTYSGSLHRVLLRLLNGYDVVIRSSPTGLKVSVFNAPTKPGMAGPVGIYAAPARTGVSSNVDLDDEKTQRAAAPPTPPPPQQEAPAAPHRFGAPITPIHRPASTAAASSHPKVSSNVDLDEEMSTQGATR
jgi:hypothetical protein